METRKGLGWRIEHLFQKLADLEDLAERIAARIRATGKQQMNRWFENVKRVQIIGDKIDEELVEPKTVPEVKKFKAKVIRFLKIVYQLEEEGKVKAKLQRDKRHRITAADKLKELERNQLQRFTPADLTAFTKNYSTLVGKGAHGCVYIGQFPDEFPVAVKVLDKKYITSDEEAFMAEVRTMWRASHENLIKLYGFCFTTEIKALVYEYMEKGSLDQYLYYNQSSKTIEWGKLYQIAIETGQGLVYLHEGLKDQIVHGDVNASNVLLDWNLFPKLTDLAVPKLVNMDLSHVFSTGNNESSSFAASKVRNPESLVTYKCDVYRFGMMLFEILGRRKNLTKGMWFPDQVRERVNSSKIDQLLDECCIYKEEDRKKAKILCIVALRCTQNKSESIPTMISVVNMLERDTEQGRLKADSEERLLKELQRNKCQQFTPEHLEKFTKNYSTPIGEGAYGRVYKGWFPNHFPIAVKVLDDKDNTLVEEAFMAEVRTMGRTSHRNLVKLYGYCFTEEKKALVYEYMENGTLDRYLHNESSGLIEWGKLYQITIDIAHCLFYLHEGLKDQIIHGNVKPSNVLLDSDLTPKLADFGLAKLMNRNVSCSSGTYESDVYCYGMMLFEILETRKNLSKGKSFPDQLEAMIKSLETDQLLDDCCIYEEEERKKAKILSEVAELCTLNKPESRPTMISVVMMLEGKIEVTPYVNQVLNPYTQLPPSNRVDKEPQTPEESDKGVPVTTEEEEDHQTTDSVDLDATELNPQDENSVITYTGNMFLESLTMMKQCIDDLELMLERFTHRCPPHGEHSVIIYTTTDPSARESVLEECDHVRFTLNNRKIVMSERDCYLNPNYKLELESVLGEPTSLPRLFVRGRDIGGMFMFRWIEKTGDIDILLHGIPPAMAQV